MADFVTNLWESVFTPGTTPTLLIATNVTFGALQVVLFGLLIATYSIHFAILSVLCGGLWFSINWFARELQAAQRAEVEAERLRKKKQAEKDWQAQDGGAADDEGEDTEVEDSGMRRSEVTLDEGVGGLNKEQMDKIAKAAVRDRQIGSQATGIQAVSGQTRQRRADESSSELSTDSEWEKVEGR